MRSTTPTVSIVIPTLNEASNIAACLDSLIAQNYPKNKLEILIVDDDSTDATLDIIKNYPVKLLHNGRHHGEIGKMIGFRASTGELFTYLDADIVVHPNWLSHLVVPLISDPSIIGAFTAEGASPASPALSRYLALDPLQRDNLYQWFSPSIDSTITAQTLDFFVCEFTVNRIPPAGRCIYRRRQLAKYIAGFTMFLELDFLKHLVLQGLNKFAYVPQAKLYHHHVRSLTQLLSKRKYNLTKVYLAHVANNLYTWIDWRNPLHLIKLGLWVIYANLFVPSLITGIIKCFKHKTWLGLYEPFVDIAVTDTLVLAFLSSRYGPKS